MTKELDKAPANSFLQLCETLDTIKQVPSEQERIHHFAHYLQTVSAEPVNNATPAYLPDSDPNHRLKHNPESETDHRPRNHFICETESDSRSGTDSDSYSDFNPEPVPDLDLAVRYAGEGIFPAVTGLRISIGHQTIAVAAASFCGIDYENVYKPCRSATGNTAETVGKLMANLPEAVSRRKPSDIPLSDLDSFFDKLAALKQRKEKEKLLTRIWEKMTSREVRATVRLLTQGSLLPAPESRSTSGSRLDQHTILQAIATAFHAEPGQVRRVFMITGNLGETAVLARQGKLHTAGIRLFRPVPFMQPATLEPDDITGCGQPGKYSLPDDPGAHIAEEMINGIRTQMHLSRENVLLCSSTGTNITATFPDAVDLLPPDMDTFSLILDGELCIYENSAVQSLHRLQKRMASTDPGPELIANHPARFIAHDLLFHNDQPVTDKPLYRRRKRLEEVCRKLGIPVIRQFEIRSKRDIALRIASAVQNGSCGIMLKKRESLYEPGECTGSWLELKPSGGSLKAVVMYAHTGNGPQGGPFSGFTVGIRVDNDPRYVETFIPIGKVTAGNMNPDLKKLDKRIRELTVERFGPTLSLKPGIVLEVEFESIQTNRRTKAGLALHKPRIRAVHPDLSPSDTDTLRHVESLCRQRHNITPAPESEKRPEQHL